MKFFIYNVSKSFNRFEEMDNDLKTKNMFLMNNFFE